MTFTKYPNLWLRVFVGTWRDVCATDCDCKVNEEQKCISNQEILMSPANKFCI